MRKVSEHLIKRSIIYFVDPKRLAEKVKWEKRNYSNCFAGGGWNMDRSEAVIRWNTLKEDIQRAGFNHRCPIHINQENEIINGNHRFAIALELDLKYIPVEFRWWEPI